jgi:hypothetical protein
MDTHTAAENIRSHQSNALKLRVVQHKYNDAARIANHARAVRVRHHAKALMRLHNQIRSEAVALVGPDYAWFHCSLGFEPFTSIAQQSNSDAWGRHVLGAGLVDIYNAADFMAEDAGQVAACTMPPKTLD